MKHVAALCVNTEVKKFILLLSFIAFQDVVAQKVDLIRLSELQDKIEESEANLTIINFWATWCGPCVKEIPHFERANQQEEVKVYLVSLDFPSQLQKVEQFVAKRSLDLEVMLLDEKDPDTYMRKVNSDWSGAIPATLFVTDLGKTYFHESAFTREELEHTITKYLD